MSEDVLRASIDFLMQKSRRERDVTVLFFGGEPLLALDLIRFAVEYANNAAAREGKRVGYSMTTNGTLFDADSLAFCRENSLRFLLSIDGARESHNKHRRLISGEGSFDLVARKIRMMKAAQPWMGARVTPTPATMNKIADNVMYLYKLGINQFLVGPATGIEYSDDDIALFKREMLTLADFYIAMVRRKAPFRLTLFESDSLTSIGSKSGVWGCGAGRGTLSISTSGELQPCAKIQGLHGLKGINRYSLGNVMSGTLANAVRREFIMSSYERRTECHSCESRDDCAGGCAAVNYQATGSIWLPDESQCKIVHVITEMKKYVRSKLAAS